VSRLALHVLFFLSGAAALGYQLVWAKIFSTGLGHEMPAVLAIIAAFMAGMALGAWGLDRFIPRSARAGLWLGGLELVIGAWALLMSFFIPSANEFALRLIGLAPGAFQHWLIAFLIPALVLLPATAAMGATLPAMEKFLSALAPQNESIGSVYAANTFGAVAGTLLTPFTLMPALGFSRTCWALAVVNVAVALGTLALGRSADSHVRANAPATKSKKHEHADPAIRTPLSPRRLAFTLFCTGLLGIAYEVAGVRVLSQVLEGTVFTYAAVLAVFLLGTAAGAAAFHRWWREVEPGRLLAALLWTTALACFAGMSLMVLAPGLHQFARRLGDSTLAVLMAELLVAASVLALPSFGMGAMFSHLVQQSRAARGGIGNVFAWNTLGAALAPALGGAMLVPLLGTKWTLFTVSAGYVVLIFLPREAGTVHTANGVGNSLRRARRSTWPPMLCALAAAGALFADLRIVSAPPDEKVIAYREGVMASVAVTEDTATNRTLRVDNRYQMGGTAAADAEYRQAHLPLLLHPSPQRALFLGVGTGISLGAASLYPGLQADAVELVPEVVNAMKFFEAKNFSAAQNPNFQLHTADARRFVRVSEQTYDVIIADLFHPYRDGAGALYTREHFAAARQRLATNGLFCQWLPLHQLDEATLRVIVRTFTSVFPNCEAWLLRFNVEMPVMALVGWTGTPRRSPSQVERQLDAATLGPELKRLALADSLRVFGHLLADADDLARFASSAPVNTDDNQRVTFMAPRAAYQHDEKPYASLLALLAVSRTEHIVGEWSLPSTNSDFAARLTRYLAARNVYLRGLVHDSEQRRDDAIDSYVESARLSPGFTTGYAQGLSIATVLASSDPARARMILERLIEAQPERPVARQMLDRLFPK
jgi:spermidine synthase